MHIEYTYIRNIRATPNRLPYIPRHFIINFLVYWLLFRGLSRPTKAFCTHKHTHIYTSCRKAWYLLSLLKHLNGKIWNGMGGCKLEHIKLCFLFNGLTECCFILQGQIWREDMDEENEVEEMGLINQHVLMHACMTGKHLDRRLEQRAKQIPHVKYEGVYWTNLFLLTKAMCCIFTLCMHQSNPFFYFHEWVCPDNVPPFPQRQCVDSNIKNHETIDILCSM